MLQEETERFYVCLDTRFSDEILSDGYRVRFDLSKLIRKKYLENITSVKIYSFVLNKILLGVNGSSEYKDNVFNQLAVNRISVKFDEILESYKHQTRKFHFLGETDRELSKESIVTTDVHWIFDNTLFTPCFNDGVFLLNEPIKILDTLTVSFGNPINLVPVAVIPYGIMFHLEFTCIKKRKLDVSVAKIGNGNVSVRINENVFNKYQGKRIFLSLNTNLAFVNSLGYYKWLINDFNILYPGYAAVANSIKNVLAVSIKSSFINSGYFSNANYDKILIYVEEFGNECFRTYDNIPHQFISAQSSTLVDNYKKIDLNTYQCNKGWYYSNIPITEITSITMKSYARYITEYGEILYKPISILNESYRLTGLFAFSLATPLIVFSGALGFPIGSPKVGDKLYLYGFVEPNISQDIVAVLNRPEGFTITGFTQGGWYIDAYYNFGILYYTGPSDQPGFIYFKNVATSINFEFICS